MRENGSSGKLLPAELHELALSEGSQDIRMIIFEEATLRTVELQWRQSISAFPPTTQR
jgi:hypothetical protein